MPNLKRKYILYITLYFNNGELKLGHTLTVERQRQHHKRRRHQSNIKNVGMNCIEGVFLESLLFNL